MIRSQCYDCKFRGTVPGSCHSSCNHPAITGRVRLAGLIATASGVTSFTAAGVKITASPHGVASGWFLWPDNFDPVWLEECTGFTQKETHETKPKESDSAIEPEVR